MSKLTRLLTLSVSLFLVPFFLDSTHAGESGKKDWPRWRGGNQNGMAYSDGMLRFDEGKGLKVAWKKTLGSGYSSISVADGHAVTMFSDSTYDYVVSFDAETGAEEWRFKIAETYIGHDGSHNGPLSTPLIDRNKVFALGPKGDLLALDLKTGNKLWSTHFESDHKSLPPFYGFTTSPLVDGDVLVVETGGQNNTISGFNKNSGKLLWATGTDTVNYQSPIMINIDGNDQLVCVGNKYLYGLNPQTGKMLWEFHHNGNANTINPVFFGSNKLFYNNTGREFMLIEIKKENNQYKVNELWKTKNIGRTLSTPVYHDGHFYGYSRQFLSCIDANTGEMQWKSRPPGNGFLILVDDYLVVQTRAGAMHIVKASPEKYEEVATIELFDKITWTPPSFANGRIYARNLYEVASLEIGDVDQVVAKAKPKQMVAPASHFADWVRKVERAANKQAHIDEFLKKHKTSPVIEDKTYAHIFYNGEVQDLVITGDVVDTGEFEMNRIDGTNFYYASFELEPDARLDYRFTRNFEERIPDPLNDAKVPSFRGEVSSLQMPDWQHPAHFEEPTTSQRGTIDSLDFESKVLENKRTVKVYLPAGYNNGNQRYPVVYVNYGKLAMEAAKMPNTLDNLRGKSIKPVIAVFIFSPNSFQEYARAQRDKYAQMVAEELVPHIDQKYRTIADADSRLFMGGDEGGYAAIFAAFKYPGLVNNLAGQSTHLYPTAGGDVLTAMVKESAKQPFNFYLDWGKYDSRSKANDYHWADFNKDFVELLKSKGYAPAAQEVNEGFGWASWRNRTDKILMHFFPIDKTQK